jgi:hypothetical protein
MPFDGHAPDCEPEPPPRRIWYALVPAGQRRYRKRWTVRLVDTSTGSCLFFSFYADTKREAYGTASWAVRRAFP